MSRPQTYEQCLLSVAEQILSKFTNDYKVRMLVLEACSALYGSFNIDEYWDAFHIKVIKRTLVIEKAKELYKEINNSGIDPSMAIASLSREPITESEMKKNGAFYTDYRLSQFISNDCLKYIKKHCSVADLAVGSGILLAGIADRYYSKYPENYDAWISNNVYAYDLSANALRGARIAIAVHSSSVKALVKMYEKWAICDSLFSDKLEGASFDIVVGNPPWGKTKLSLHSYVNGNGANHVYGSDFEAFDRRDYEHERSNQLLYCKKLKEKYSLIGDAEPDMYMAFLQRAMSVLKKNGHLSYIVPAGLIRSQGTESLRRDIINHSRSIKYYLLDNKARFFSIDSRFKFLVLSLNTIMSSASVCNELNMSLCHTEKNNICCGEEVTYKVSELEAIRPDLTIPECRNDREKALFFKICNNGQLWKEKWQADVSREVDMTNNRQDFHCKKTKGDIPVVEGRMVQQFRFGAKEYVSGSGRSAQWLPTSSPIVKPQFYIKKAKLNLSIQDRINHYRVGYCDIAGQTNERAMMSALIPPMVVCGNKVPTIMFDADNVNITYFWIGITNSFVFDWLLRRVLTTTVNYFLLFSLPMPDVDIESSIAKKIIVKSKILCEMKSEYYTDTATERLRAELDVLVAEAYGLDYSDLEVVLDDFPLLDRAQNRLDNEERSTITKDLLLSLAEKRFNIKEKVHSKRYNNYVKTGARAYIPTEMTSLTIKE